MSFPSSKNSSVQFGLPQASVFRFPTQIPDIKLHVPQIRKWTQPFDIPPAIWNLGLEPYFPFTIVFSYISFALLFQWINYHRGGKPWSISRTQFFKQFILLHNLSLAIFSAWTFLSVISLLNSSWPAHDDSAYLAKVAHRICSMCNDSSLTHAENGEFYYIGWIFYMSKIYELIDTAVIYAKGKRASVLQIYHHAGVIICSWGVMRFISPPAMIGIIFNSAVHTIMYTYYFLVSARIRVPLSWKATLTALQIVQFVVGLLAAATYLFIQYDILPSQQSIVTSPLDPRAVSSDSDLYNLQRYPHQPRLISIQEAGLDSIDRQMVPCVSNSNEMLGLWLGILYLPPLTVLFSRFFTRSYVESPREKVD